MEAAHTFLLIGGGVGLVCILTGLWAARIGTPVLLVFLVLGMLVGEDGPGHILFDDYEATYTLGSIALVVILLEGGIKTSSTMLTSAGLPALLLATVGVAIPTAIVGAAVVALYGASWTYALLVAAMVSPTDAAAVAALLRAGTVKVPERVSALLEVESGLNDPMAVFLTLVLTELLVLPGSVTAGRGALMFAWEMGGGGAIGLAGGWIVARMLAGLKAEASLLPVLLLAAGFAIFGGAQMLHASGFLAVYVAGIMVRGGIGARLAVVEKAFEAFAWVAQIGLFVLLGLLVTPHRLIPFLVPATVVGLMLTLVGRPLAVALCLRPFGFAWGEIGFAAWVGLRGAVPIYLAIIPVLRGVPGSDTIFAGVFVIVLLSLALQGWTIGPAARLFGFRK